MGAGKDMWMAEVERIVDDFADGTIDEAAARALLKAKGFYPDEIDDMVSPE